MDMQGHNVLALEIFNLSTAVCAGNMHSTLAHMAIIFPYTLLAHFAFTAMSTAIPQVPPTHLAVFPTPLQHQQMFEVCMYVKNLT